MYTPPASIRMVCSKTIAMQPQCRFGQDKLQFAPVESFPGSTILVSLYHCRIMAPRVATASETAAASGIIGHDLKTPSPQIQQRGNLRITQYAAE